MTALLLIFLSGIAEGFMDTFVFRPDTNKLNYWFSKQQLSPFDTWASYPEYPIVGRLDPWHVAKYFKWIFIIVTIVLVAQKGLINITIPNVEFSLALVNFALFWVSRNLGFWLTFSVLLYKKRV